MWDPYYQGKGSLLAPVTKVDSTTSTTLLTTMVGSTSTVSASTTTVETTSTVPAITESTSLLVFTVSKSTSINSLSPIIEETALDLATTVSPNNLTTITDTLAETTFVPATVPGAETSEPISMVTVPDITEYKDTGPSSYISLLDLGDSSLGYAPSEVSTQDGMSLLSVTEELASTLAPLSGATDTTPDELGGVRPPVENVSVMGQVTMPDLPRVPERIIPMADVLDHPLLPTVTRDSATDSRVHLASAVAAGAVATVLLSVAVLFIMKAYWTRRHGEEVLARGAYSSVSVTESINRVLMAPVLS